MKLASLLDSDPPAREATTAVSRRPKAEIKPRPSTKRKGKGKGQRRPKRGPASKNVVARKERKKKPLAPGVADPSQARIPTRVLRRIQSRINTKGRTGDRPKKEQARWRAKLDPFVPWRLDKEKAKATTRKHKRGGAGPAWEFVEDEPEVDEQEEADEAEAARKRRARAAAFSLGMARSRKIGMRKNSSTTAQVCAAYPLGVHSAAMDRGVFLGHDTLGGGGAFIYDPFEALEELVSYGVTNTNMMLFGQPGQGKSALIKTMLERIAAVYGTERFTVICDVKGEYDVLAERMGLTRIRLEPGGTVRVNPLEFIGRAKSISDITASRIS